VTGTVTRTVTKTVTKETGGQKTDLTEIQDYVKILSMKDNEPVMLDPWQGV